MSTGSLNLGIGLHTATKVPHMKSTIIYLYLYIYIYTSIYVIYDMYRLDAENKGQKKLKQVYIYIYVYISYDM